MKNVTITVLCLVSCLLALSVRVAPAAPARATLMSPVPGSALASSSAVFSWSVPGGRNYYLTLGTTQGGTNLSSSGSLGDLWYLPLGGLPTSAQTIWCRLYWYDQYGCWFQDFTLRAASAGSLGSAIWLQTTIPFYTIGSVGSVYGECVAFVRAARPELTTARLPNSGVGYAADLAEALRPYCGVNTMPRQGALVVAPYSGYPVGTKSRTTFSGHVGIVTKVLSRNGNVWSLRIRDANGHGNQRVDERVFNYDYTTGILTQAAWPTLGMTGSAPSKGIQFVHERR